ncbi:ERP1 protein precursor [Piromyces finnis]|uniref:ERP1 protein n=1 Tax=Piromyces finnis TaxID=1754191 RepID=A0A1Y1VE06_9FUNG|nr:ERP1 protein precursor [Piromyces finnis]|eukprot:ORX53014.1 ERP1 protein precursor [Piromyces finnis]
MHLSHQLGIVFLFLGFLCNSVKSMYFFLEGGEQKCFMEELSKGTVIDGNYKTQEFDTKAQIYRENPNSSLLITIDEIFDKGHRVLNQRSGSSGRFTFTAADTGDHLICVMATTRTWFSKESTKLFFDMKFSDNVFDNTQKEDAEKEKLSSINLKIRDLNSKVASIKREQQYQRTHEIEFRDQSEATNSHIMYWTIIQLIIIVATCYWQMRYLKNFFVAKKLV